MCVVSCAGIEINSYLMSAIYAGSVFDIFYHVKSSGSKVTNLRLSFYLEVNEFLFNLLNNMKHCQAGFLIPWSCEAGFHFEINQEFGVSQIEIWLIFQ